MKIIELRIGNLVQLTTVWFKKNPKLYNTVKVIKVDDISKEQFANDIYYVGGYDLKDIEGIQLTEEWLRKFGFVDKYKNDSTTLQEKKHRHHIVIRGSKFYYRVPGVTLTEIYFVHELQNLHYALTKDELVLAVTPKGID